MHQELHWLNETALTHQKNYQIWHHRQLVVDRLDSPDGETDFIAQMFEQDSKNYHVWCYRQWLVKRFGLWDSGNHEQAEGELADMDRLIEKDVRNNSAWNHRFFVVCGDENAAGVKDVEVRDREIRWAVLSLHRMEQCN